MGANGSYDKKLGGVPEKNALIQRLDIQLWDIRCCFRQGKKTKQRTL